MGKQLRPQTSIVNPELSQRGPGGPSSTAACAGLEALLGRYDAFSLGQRGVLCDGEAGGLYPGVAECLQRLSEARKPYVVVSNFAGRAELLRMRLLDLGLDPSHLAGVVTSGELAHSYLGRRGYKLGSRVLWISCAPGQDERLGEYFADLEGYSLTADVEDADFLLASGVEALCAGTEEERLTGSTRGGSLKPFTKTFRRAISRGLPMVCANPELRAAEAGGACAHLPGVLTRYYEKLGGHVTYFGLPYTAAFEEARRLLDEALAASWGEGAPEPARICHIGDSLHKDVRGATKAGLDAALVVRTGAHAQELPEEPSAKDVVNLCRKAKVPLPSVFLPRFAW